MYRLIKAGRLMVVGEAFVTATQLSVAKEDISVTHAALWC